MLADGSLIDSLGWGPLWLVVAAVVAALVARVARRRERSVRARARLTCEQEARRRPTRL